MKLGQTDLVQNVNVRVFGGTDKVNSVGPIAHFGDTETLQRETESLKSHLGETEIPIGETNLPRVCGSGYDI